MTEKWHITSVDLGKAREKNEYYDKMDIENKKAMSLMSLE